MTEQIIAAYYCPGCCKSTQCNVSGATQKNRQTDPGRLASQPSQFSLQCRACNRVFHEWSNVFSTESYQIETDKNRAENIPSTDISTGLQDLYSSVEVDVKAFTTAGVRLVIDLIFEDLDIDPALSFEKKLEAFSSHPNASPNLVDALKHMIDADNSAIHPAWDPAIKDIEDLMAELERFLKTQYGPKPIAKEKRWPNLSRWAGKIRWPKGVKGRTTHRAAAAAVET